MFSLCDKVDDGVISEDRKFRKKFRFWGLDNDLLDFKYL